MCKILNVAEKNSVAKEISNQLGNGNVQKAYSDSKFNPVYIFNY